MAAMSAVAAVQKKRGRGRPAKYAAGAMSTQLTIRINSGVVERARKAAAKQGYSLGDMLRRRIDELAARG